MQQWQRPALAAAREEVEAVGAHPMEVYLPLQRGRVVRGRIWEVSGAVGAWDPWRRPWVLGNAALQLQDGLQAGW